MNIDELTEATINNLQEFYGYGSFDEYAEDLEYKFVEKVTNKIKKVFPDAEVFEETESRGGEGTDHFTVTINDNEYTYEFDIAEEENMLYSDGAAKTATYYAKQIISDLRSKLSNNKKVEATKELSTRYCIKYFYNNKFIGYLNSFGDSRGHVWIRLYAGNNTKYIRKFNTERGAKISMNGPYAEYANELIVNSDNDKPVHVYSKTILKDESQGMDFKLLTSSIATLDDTDINIDLSELKAIEAAYNKE